jgi:hypothetical protein
VTVVNRGPSDAQAVTLTEALPAGADSLQITAAPGNPDPFSFALAGTTFTSAPATVAAGNTDTFVVVARATQPGTFALVASASGATPDPVADNQITYPTQVIASPVTATGTQGPATPTPAGALTFFALAFGPGSQLEALEVDQKGQVFVRPLFGGPLVFVHENIVLSNLQTFDGAIVGVLQGPGAQSSELVLFDFFDPFVFNAAVAALFGSPA